ncbi:MAG: hypothetical protein JAY97_12550 [Candidatus Thiodiazotropha sp. 'RUGA']|nr:hypothetical protein [Candidatus Thiodiazotropha sp. 'RUGA']
MKLIVSIAALLSSMAVVAADNRWLSLESEGMYILKLYGLSGGDYITVNISSSVVNNEERAIKQFYMFTDKDKQRLIRIDDQYHVQLTTIPGLSVITTMRRTSDQSGKKILIHYQAFYVANRQKIWYVRTELNNRLDLLIENYSQVLDYTFTMMNIGNLSDVTKQRKILN